MYNIFFRNTHTNPIARRAVTTFQPYKKTIKPPKETHQPLSFVMDVLDKPADLKEVELTEVDKKTLPEKKKQKKYLKLPSHFKAV